MLIHNTTRYLKLHYFELMSLLQQRNWKVVCVAPADSSTASLESAGITCINLPMNRRSMNPLREAQMLARLRAVMRRETPDAVLNFSIKPAIYGSLAARLSGVNRVCSMITGLGYVFMDTGSRAQRLLGTAVRTAYKAALSGNRTVFFQNPDDQALFVDRGIVSESQCAVLAGTGIDTGRFLPARDGPGDEKVKFLFVGRLLADKGIREYVAAARKLLAEGQPAQFGILGPFDDNPSAITKAEMESWVHERTVEYLGETDDVAGVMAGYHVFVLPSYREGLPRATLEAMSMAKPVVTTDVPGCRETVTDGVNGFLVPVKNVPRLNAAMKRFVVDRNLIRSMGSESRSIVQARFDVHAVNERIVGLIEQDWKE